MNNQNRDESNNAGSLHKQKNNRAQMVPEAEESHQFSNQKKQDNEGRLEDLASNIFPGIVQNKNEEKRGPQRNLNLKIELQTADKMKVKEILQTRNLENCIIIKSNSNAEFQGSRGDDNKKIKIGELLHSMKNSK